MTTFNLEQELIDHVGKIKRNWIIFLNDPSLTDRVRPRIKELIATMVDPKLLPFTRHSAAQTLVLAGYSDRAPAEFWGTELGQAMYRWGGYPYSVVPTQDVRNILGVSRQAIWQMQHRGHLMPAFKTEPLTEWTTDSVYARWQQNNS